MVNKCGVYYYYDLSAGMDQVRDILGRGCFVFGYFIGCFGERIGAGDL